MKIGQTFTFRRSGNHFDFALIILAEPNGQKYLYNATYGVRQGEAALLNAKIGPVVKKSEIENFLIKHRIAELFLDT